MPRYLEGGEPVDGEEGYPVMVVSSGELMEQVGVLHRTRRGVSLTCDADNPST